jgi:hypothetical protein
MSNHWWTLTPASAGGYQAGTWQSQPASFQGKRYNPSFVLHDGRYIQCGGEYRYDASSGVCAQFSQPPSYNGCEIFDPQTRSWSGTQMPEAALDTPGALLGDGRALVLGYFTSSAFLFDGASWLGPGNNARATIGDNEASSVLLQDGSVFFGEQGFSRYLPDGTWLDSQPNPLGTGQLAAGDEIGAFVLLHDGRVLILGGGNNYALYTPPTTLHGTDDAWLNAPLTSSLIHGDAPACVEPTGNVLTVVQTQNSTGDGPALFEEYIRDPNPANPGTWLDVPLPNGQINHAFEVRLLALPNGQIFMSGYANGDIWLYNPAGTVDNSWRPVVTSISPLFFGEFTVWGTQLSGRTTGGSFGDDGQLATNYPIVSVLSGGSVQVYALSHSFTDTRPQPGLSSAFRFRIPSSISSGSVFFSVSASGIAAAGPFPGQFQSLPQADQGIAWFASRML